MAENSILTVSYSISSPYRHKKCLNFCVDKQSGAKRANLMCTRCADVPSLQDFRERLRNRTKETTRSEKIRFDALPTVSDIIQHARKTRAAKDQWKLNCTVARGMLCRSTARERSMRERLDAQLLMVLERVAE